MTLLSRTRRIQLPRLALRRERKRLVVLRYLRDRVFTEDRAYPEAEVNQRLALFNRDVAALRRAMVDAGLVTRSAGEYRRTDDD